MRRFASALLLLTLTACGAATTPTGGDSTGAMSPAAQSPAASAAPSDAALPSSAAQPAETATSIGTIGGGNAGAADEVERQAQATLARQLNIAPETLILQNKEEVEWSDGGLGCASPDMMYAQVITPGYKLTYSDGGQNYELHTNQNGTQVVWCENGKPRDVAQP